MVANRTDFSNYFTCVGNHFFSDICDFGRTTDIWHSLQVTQLRIQPVECQYIILDCGHVTFSFSKLNSPVLLTGLISANQNVFGCALYPHKASIIVQENMISSEMFFRLNAGQIFQITLQPETVLCIFQIRPDLLEKKSLYYVHQALLNQLSKNLYFCFPEKPSMLKSYLANLYHQAIQNPVKNYSKFQTVSAQYVAEDLITLLAEALPSGLNTGQAHSKPHFKKLRRSEMVYEAVTLLRNNLHKQIRIEDLSKKLNVSKRSLCYGFKEMFGIGPIRFLKIERLQRIRQALTEANPKFNRVVIIAEQFGIYSPGHFAKDYQQMFGETPSKTLKRQL